MWHVTITCAPLPRVCVCPPPTRVVQVELEALGLTTAYTQLHVAELGNDVWQGVRNKYWHFPVYFLPLVQHDPHHHHHHHAHAGAHAAVHEAAHEAAQEQGGSAAGRAEADVTAAL